MGIILLEATDSRQTRESTMQFVSVKHTEVSHSDGEISVRVLNHIEHNAMARAVHGLESMLFTCLVNEENVLLVLEVVATDLPKFGVVDIGRNNLTVASDSIFGSHELDETVVDDSSVRVEKSAAG
jgi:hypothetical protein